MPIVESKEDIQIGDLVEITGKDVVEIKYGGNNHTDRIGKVFQIGIINETDPVKWWGTYYTGFNQLCYPKESLKRIDVAALVKENKENKEEIEILTTKLTNLNYLFDKYTAISENQDRLFEEMVNIAEDLLVKLEATENMLNNLGIHIIWRE